MKKSTYTLLLTLLFLLPKYTTAQCNGDLSLCDRAYHEVAYFTTHNSYNAGLDGFNAPNHTYGITQQLQDGVRALMIDVYDLGGIPTVFHGYDLLGTAPFTSNLLEIKTFLDQHPNEIITIILECYTTANDIEAALDSIGLMPYLYAKDGEWASLQQMIDTNQRLVIFTDVDDASDTQNWYHYVWQHAVETHYAVHDTSSFTCQYNRGNPWNDLFIFNHFITHPTFGVGLMDQAQLINESHFLLPRATACAENNNKFPNFITVDFHEIGDTKYVVDVLNGVVTTHTDAPLSIPIGVYPNPVRNHLYLKNINTNVDYRIYSSNGQLLRKNSTTQNFIPTEKLPKGSYIFQLKTLWETQYVKVVKL